ncbi:MAG: DNA repair protein RadA, partial [Bacillota bacterium]|nr:DNA repair protein RadA [Bacillota bacterium]
MGKGKSKYTCSECGHESHGWMGRCPGCGAWNTLVEEPVVTRPLTGRGNWALAAPPQTTSGNSPVIKLSQVPAEDQPRLSSKLSELDRVLGGGYVRGSLVLIGGDPGIGKSTLL